MKQRRKRKNYIRNEDKISTQERTDYNKKLIKAWRKSGKQPREWEPQQINIIGERRSEWNER